METRGFAYHDRSWVALVRRESSREKKIKPMSYSCQSTGNQKNYGVVGQEKLQLVHDSPSLASNLEWQPGARGGAPVVFAGSLALRVQEDRA